MNELDLIRLLTQLLPFYKPTAQWHVDIELVPVVKSSSSRDKTRNTYFVRIASFHLSFRPSSCFSTTRGHSKRHELFFTSVLHFVT